jgi:lysophospholipase L1-like esterase
VGRVPWFRQATSGGSFHYAGDNDLAGGLSPDEVARDFQAFATSLHAVLPECRLVFLSIKPSASQWHLWPQARAANARIREICEAEGKPRLRLVDVSTPLRGADGQPDPRLFLDDRLHLNNDGYAKWRAVLAPVLAGSRCMSAA